MGMGVNTCFSKELQLLIDRDILLPETSYRQTQHGSQLFTDRISGVGEIRQQPDA